MRLPWAIRLHMVARAYGQAPAALREWAADDLATAMALLGYLDD